jgi:hypothetical protein
MGFRSHVAVRVKSRLDAQPQLGRDMFERGHGYTQMGPVVAADLAGLFQPCLSVLQKPESRMSLYSPGYLFGHQPKLAAGCSQCLKGFRKGAES